MLKNVIAVVLTISVASIGSAQGIVLSDPIPPRSSSHVFTEECEGGHIYTMESSEGASGRRLIARVDGKEISIDKPTLLGAITGLDLYAVHMHCTGDGSVFITEVGGGRKAVRKQSILIKESGSVVVLR